MKEKTLFGIKSKKYLGWLNVMNSKQELLKISASFIENHDFQSSGGPFEVTAVHFAWFVHVKSIKRIFGMVNFQLIFEGLCQIEQTRIASLFPSLKSLQPRCFAPKIKNSQLIIVTYDTPR